MLREPHCPTRQMSIHSQASVSTGQRCRWVRTLSHPFEQVWSSPPERATVMCALVLKGALPTPITAGRGELSPELAWLCHLLFHGKAYCSGRQLSLTASGQMGLSVKC